MPDLWGLIMDAGCVICGNEMAVMEIRFLSRNCYFHQELVSNVCNPNDIQAL